ncbi:hypothetical protein GHT06_019953 [Daphnia sinensis]|uniref:Ionotropic glutamate receptor C-terminal domain-containing protein n=1 Tax=Daphnia sinensis TaxID=1820382 RepID=A0AAD5KLZ2_9CRUS|nr:hypothetical protein GHT06_019953 [Daphnia sinensis]
MKLTWLFAVAAHVYQPTLWLVYPTKVTAIEEGFQKKDHLLVVVNQECNRSHPKHGSFTLVPGNTTTIEDVGSKPGHITNMLRLKADVMIAAMGLAPGRSASVEFVHPWIFSPAAFLIPMPKGWQINVDAVIKPFQPLVWLGLVTAAISITVTLLGYNYLAKKKNKLIEKREKAGRQQIIVVTQDLIMYIIGTLLNQGGYIPCKITKIRLLVGAWCLLTLVLVNVYNGILISFVTTIRPTPPIIDSETDVGYDPNIYLIVNRGLAGDVWFSTAGIGLYKAYGDKLRAYSKSKCNSTAICVEMVKSLPHQHAYFNTMHSVKEVIRQDYQQTKECQLTMLPNTVNYPVCWGVAKKSPHLENFNRGTLRLHEIGLILLWEGWFTPDTRPCWRTKQNIGRNKNEKKPLLRLSLDNLIGAFALLMGGSMISLFVFIMENIFSRWKKIRW